MKVMKTPWFLGGGLSLLILNIKNSHLSVPVPTMNNRSSTQLWQIFELLIHIHRLALVNSVGHSPLCDADKYATNTALN